MTKLSQEDFEDYMYMKTGEIQSASSRMSSIEKSFSELQESVLEMAKRQHTIMTALIVLADKYDIVVEKDDEL